MENRLARLEELEGSLLPVCFPGGGEWMRKLRLRGEGRGQQRGSPVPLQVPLSSILQPQHRRRNVTVAAVSPSGGLTLTLQIFL